MKCERRGAFRVPIQVGVKLRLRSEQDTVDIEGILLDLSDNGMDVLAAQPLYPSAIVEARFSLPNSPFLFEIGGEVAWANPNGESGVRFTDTSESLRAALARWVEENSQESSRAKPEPLPGCTLTDLSPSGCYIETSSPIPERTLVALCLAVKGAELQTQGLVRVMHPGHGMGIEFAVRTHEQREQTSRFIQSLTEQPGTRPELLVFPKTLGVSGNESCALSDEMEDLLLDLLRNHEAFSEDTFIVALRSQRGREIVESQA